MAIAALTENVEMATVLKKIIEDKQSWLVSQQASKPLETFKMDVKPSDRDFYQSLNQTKTAFILECKKASPSKGLIRDDFDPATIAKVYKDYASAISVLTDEKYFQGRFEFLPIVRNEVTQPVLCKDFIIDEYQIYLARYYQADAILLMLSVVNDDEYRHLSRIAHQLNMGILTEASTQAEVERAIALGAKVIGINNRNLRDLSVDLNRVKNLSKTIPDDRIIISESGIYTHNQVKELSQFANGFLIGSALMSEPNLTLAIRKVMLGENKVCGLTRAEDAIAAYQAGAVYGGLIFAPKSPRYISPINARIVISAAPLNWVGVFKNETIDQVCQIAEQLSLYAVQLHGDEDNQYIQLLREKLPKNCQIWKALSISNTIPEHNNPLVSRYIFDHGAGGTGKSFDWSLLAGQDLTNVILAGGINPQNIKNALATNVIGVDLNSGIEISPGIKDKHKIQAVFEQI
ncbi:MULTISPECIES: bifunctional indole-3-glycerol-phosphate synthase TrpC/phosphoribosylanthranilate isomerase TrpF [unclassified Gilliamella]|uniref:bifunctional indole-3-glycerol-phosphate synthase TrpC/phosphoribosylanthranilate isomerase TrpF n=1 Tax=unclassified Gilliamella TaxID=2685620 RepID=UPI002A029D13|nr:MULTISPECIES: bifunctional indole-3-glycerol-phosphate synthase TrpC/phosphoribosylanthranilate isomerase TrpF [unclassified Gilliamella]MCX8641649.1 bifunctional indole-3-glycerol-phosphate synthase TrpC/phosphoribosylanthranilate isomerase TrpF [Gilliamella sp. B3835]MCX8706864.1 bifunctional indole-3-glycerol-phosphate synthase TrpC/phosphoribosylanthranilate isomerase TrpF [Gilliamella sp. B3783]MCX8708722.1 bifunctional indole-3-glycerol-phosphate synthase TrpC/phosphoribosylanthranilate